MRDNILIVYFSHYGGTQKLAKLIQQKTGGAIFEIHPEKAYPASYDATVAQAKKRDSGELSAYIENPNQEYR